MSELGGPGPEVIVDSAAVRAEPLVQAPNPIDVQPPVSVDPKPAWAAPESGVTPVVSFISSPRPDGIASPKPSNSDLDTAAPGGSIAPDASAPDQVLGAPPSPSSLESTSALGDSDASAEPLKPVENMDELRDRVGRERERARLKIEGTLNNSDIFNTPELKAAAQAALDSQTRDIRATLQALGRIKEYVGDVPTELAEVSEMYDSIYNSIQVSGEDEVVHSLAELDAEFATADSSRQAEITAIKEKGAYGYKFNNEQSAEEVDTVAVAEIQTKAMDDYETRLLKDIKDKQDKDPNANVSDEQALVDIIRGARGYADKPLRDYILGDAIRVLNAHYRDIPGAEGLQVSAEAAAQIEAARLVSRELLLKNMEATGMGRSQAESILELGEGGKTEEMLNNFNVFKYKNVAELITGQKFKNQEEATKFMDKMLGQMKDEKYKKLKGMGWIAILAVVAGSALKDFGANAVAQG